MGIAILYQSVKLIREQRKLKKEMNKLNHDWNIEFKNGGSVSRQRKNYGQMDDDWRHEVGDIEPTQSELRDNIDRKERHSISGHANDPSEMQKRAFEKENEK